MVSLKIAIVANLFTEQELMLHEYVVLYYVTMEVAFSYKKHTNEAERHFYKSYSPVPELSFLPAPYRG